MTAKVESVSVSKGGSGYSFGTLDLETGGVPTGSTVPVFNVIIPPEGGHKNTTFIENLEYIMF